MGGSEEAELETRDRPAAELGAELPGFTGTLSVEILFLLIFKSGTAGTSGASETIGIAVFNQIKGGEEKSKVESCTSRYTTLSFKEVRSNERKSQILFNF